MSTQGALTRARLLPTFLGALLLVLGLVMLTAGMKLVSLGGSVYYLLSGLGLAVCGLLLLLALRCAVWLFTLCLALCTVLSLWEVGLDRQQLMPRLFIWFLIGVILLIPMTRQGLKPMRRSFSMAHLLIAVVLAGVALDPMAQIRQIRPDYQGLFAVLIPSLDVVPLVIGAGDEAVAMVPEAGSL